MLDSYVYRATFVVRNVAVASSQQGHWPDIIYKDYKLPGIYNP